MGLAEWPWFQLALRFEQVEEAMGAKRTMADWSAFRASRNDKLGDIRKKQSKADTEAEARRTKRAAAVAYEGPAMMRVKRETTGRRTDCVNYSSCLDRFVAVHCQRGEANADCPSACSYYEHERLYAISRQHSPLHAGGKVAL